MKNKTKPHTQENMSKSRIIHYNSFFFRLKVPSQGSVLKNYLGLSYKQVYFPPYLFQRFDLMFLGRYLKH